MKGSDYLKCPMCGTGIAEIDFKVIKICKDCSKHMNKDTEDIPILHNDIVIGVAKSKVGGSIECILWDKFIVEEYKGRDISAIVIK